MNSNLLFDISSIFSAIPFFISIYILWKYLKNEEYSRGILKNILTGMIIGLISGLVFVIISSGVYPYMDLSIIFIILFPIYLEILKFIIYQRKKYWGKIETVFYGYGLGSGLGATFSVSLLYYYFYIHINLSYFDYFGLLIFSSSLIFINVSTTTLISYGICKKNRRILEDSIMIMILYFITLLPYIWGFETYYFSWSIIYVIPFYYVSIKKLGECIYEKI